MQLFSDAFLQLVRDWGTATCGRPVYYDKRDLQRYPDLVLKALAWHRQQREDSQYVTDYVDWEILPANPALAPRKGSGKSNGNGESRLREERLEFLQSLRPVRWWRGRVLDSSRIYIVAEFRAHVVAECPLEGNAIYGVPKNGSPRSWQEVLRHTKDRARERGAVKVVHAGDWRTRVRSLAA